MSSHHHSPYLNFLFNVSINYQQSIQLDTSKQFDYPQTCYILRKKFISTIRFFECNIIRNTVCTASNCFTGSTNKYEPSLFTL